uniref:RING-type domain-containing protein n=1 Tax=Meloidogyne incognita TaxID=6306 RepID=A0A914LQ80_MELIC
MAKGGIGLRCMATGCDNPILYSEIRMFISEDVQKKLDERILQESIGMASIDKLERCKKCNFAIQMEVDKQINKFFDCLSCKTKFCRTCERDWDDKHVGLSCEEMDKNDKDKKEREIEKKLNEAIVRKCPRCGIGFVKVSGCNKMTCRCGMTQCYICRESGIQYAHFCNEMKINEAVVRKCPRCGVQFVKEKGCNQVTCRCGMTQCYLCRQTEIQHDHFCQHYRDPNSQNCNECNKKCLLYEDANKIDQQIIKEIREKGETSVRFTTPTSNRIYYNTASNTARLTTNTTHSTNELEIGFILLCVPMGLLIALLLVWGKTMYDLHYR